MNESEQELRQQLLRAKCRADDLEQGWSNCSRACAQLQDERDTARRERDEAAARIRALEERLTAPPVQRGTTHWEDCWKDRGHHACAVVAVERLQSQLAAAERSLDRHRADALMSEIERAARDLPNGFSIQIAVENGSAWVELHNADCEEVDLCRDDRTLTEQVTEAIDAALSPTVSEGAIDSSGNRSGEGETK